MAEKEKDNKEVFTPAAAAKRPRILLLEDDPYFFELYSNRLRGGDFEVLAEADEDEGLKKALVEKPDAIILDISLPKEDDFSFIPSLKQHPEASSIPIIILTDLDDDISKKKGFSLGASDYLIRDEVSFSDIAQSVKKVSGKNK
jgi:DNA-binding response OmpR family regulator